MSDTQRLIDSTFPFVEDLLIKYGDFYPVASAVTVDDIISQVGTFHGDNNPKSDTVIVDLKKALKGKQANYKCVAIFYDVKVTLPDTTQKTDAIAVFTESQSDDSGCIIYYPYELTMDKKFELKNKAWKERNDKEIFLA